MALTMDRLNPPHETNVGFRSSFIPLATHHRTGADSEVWTRSRSTPLAARLAAVRAEEARRNPARVPAATSPAVPTRRPALVRRAPGRLPPGRSAPAGLDG